MTNEDRWLSNFEALKAHVAETGHLPNKHSRLSNEIAIRESVSKQEILKIESENCLRN